LLSLPRFNYPVDRSVHAAGMGLQLAPPGEERSPAAWRVRRVLRPSRASGCVGVGPVVPYMHDHCADSTDTQSPPPA
jgi:hypothetical protein